VNGVGYDRNITNGGMYIALVGSTYQLIGKQNIGNQYQSIGLEGKRIELEGKLSQRELEKNITDQYVKAFGEQQLLGNTAALLAAMEKENALLKQLAEKGVYRETDYLAFLVNYRQQQLAYGQQKFQLQNDILLLNYISGIIDTAFVTLQEPALQKKNLLAQTQTLQYRQFFLDSLQLKNAFEQVKYSYKPRLNLFGDAGLMSTMFSTAANNFGISAGFSVSFPIYDGRQRQMRYGKIKLSENTRLNYLQFFQKQYTQRTLQLQQQINANASLISQAEEKLKLSSAIIDAQRKMMATGDAHIADYILSLNSFITAQTTLLQLKTDQLQLINEFNYLNY
jgi:outer membrane protein TolC